MTKVAVAQFAMQSNLTNLDRIAAMSEEAAKQDTKLIVFPELSLPGYDLQVLKGTKLPAEADSVQSLQEISTKHKIAIFSGIATPTENIAVLVDAGKLLLRYSKTHLFDFKSARESDLFQRGNGPLMITSWQEFQLAPQICFDLRFPELSRHYATKGANLFVASSAWPYSRAEVFSTLSRARAIENQAYLLSSNYVGKNSSGDRFAGCSAIFAPDGSVLAKFDTEAEGLLITELDISALQTTRRELDCISKRRDTGLYSL